jgi:hypothetical protein
MYFIVWKVLRSCLGLEGTYTGTSRALPQAVQATTCHISIQWERDIGCFVKILDVHVFHSCMTRCTYTRLRDGKSITNSVMII